jgi:Flp pilus assembly protein TadG
MLRSPVHAARYRRARARRSTGSTAVEFALVLPLFVALVFGIIDGSRLMMARWLVSYANDRGGRVASLRSTTTVLQVQNAVVQSAALIGVTTANVNVEVNSGATAFTARQPGDNIHVWTTFTYRRNLSFVFTPTTIAVNASTLTSAE